MTDKQILGKWISRETEKNISEVWGAPANNSLRYKALSMTAVDALEKVITDRQREVIEYNILLNFFQRETAKHLGIDPSTVCRLRKTAIKKLNHVLSVSALALRHYELLQNEEE